MGQSWPQSWPQGWPRGTGSVGYSVGEGHAPFAQASVAARPHQLLSLPLHLHAYAHVVHVVQEGDSMGQRGLTAYFYPLLFAWRRS